jgi:hypothetical protein
MFHGPGGMLHVFSKRAPWPPEAKLAVDLDYFF